MSDRTYGTARILACPPEQAAQVAKTLQEYIGEGFDDGPGLNEAIVLTRQYFDDQASCGWVSEADAVLRELDGVAYVLTEDPAYEWLGSIAYRMADGRTFAGDTDSDQNVALTAGTFEAYVASHPDPAELVAALRRHFGTDLVREWRALEAQIEALPVEARTIRFSTQADS